MFILPFKVVEQLKRLCTRRKMIGTISPLASLLKKGRFGLLDRVIDTHIMLSKQSPAKTSLTKVSKSGRVPHPSHLPDPSQAPVVKSEPFDEAAVLRGPGMKKGKDRPEMRFSSPIVISSDESNAPTPKAKHAEGSNTFTSKKAKNSYVQFSLYLIFSFPF
jgi:hypothetical protein